MKIIEITRDYICLVDDEDYDLVSQISWQATPQEHGVYAWGKKNSKRVGMHRLIMNAPRGLHVDHINGTNEGFVLDNQKSNLRLLSHGANKRNTFKAPKNSRSGILGVRQNPCGTWLARVCPNKKNIRLGSFPTKEAASAALEDWKAKHNYRSEDFAL